MYIFLSNLIVKTWNSMIFLLWTIKLFEFEFEFEFELQTSSTGGGGGGVADNAVCFTKIEFE